MKNISIFALSMFLIYFNQVNAQTFQVLDPSKQNFPNKTIHMIGPLVGGGSDLVMRLIAPKISLMWNQVVVIDNHPSVVVPELGLKAVGDGSTIIVGGSSFLTSHLLNNVRWDPVRDFKPVTLATNSPSVLLVQPSLPVNSVQSLIRFSIANPKVLKYAAGAIGASPHLAAELFKRLSGAQMTMVPYRSNGLGLLSLISGETQMMLKDAPGVNAQIQMGKLKALAVTSAERSPLFPNLPTLDSCGLRGYEALAIDAFYVPSHTPPQIINALNKVITLALKQEEVKAKLFSNSLVVVASSPEVLGLYMKSEIVKWTPVIESMNLKIQ